MSTNGWILLAGGALVAIVVIVVLLAWSKSKPKKPKQPDTVTRIRKHEKP